MFGASATFPVEQSSRVLRSPYGPLEHQRHQHVPGFLVLHEGIPHRVVALERLYRPAHELCVIPRTHVLWQLVAQHLGPVLVSNYVLVNSLEPDVILIREVRSVAGVEGGNDFGKGPVLLFCE
jgi:hypothetical protein